MEDSRLISVIFPNYTPKPVVQKWSVKTLKMIPYFDTLFSGKWKDSSPEEITLEFDPSLFTKMVKELKAKNADEEYEMMKDFFGVVRVNKDGKKKSGSHREEFYKILSFAFEAKIQVIDLSFLRKASTIYSISLTTPAFGRRAPNLFSYKIGGDDVDSREIADATIMLNAHIAEGKSLEKFFIIYKGEWNDPESEIKAYLRIEFK